MISSLFDFKPCSLCSLSALLLVPLLVACGGTPTPDLYVLRAGDASIAPVCASGRSLTIERPLVGDEYNTKRIAVKTSATQINYYTGAEWASAFPDQFQDFLLDGLDQTHAFSSVNTTAEDNAGMIRALIAIRAAEVVNGDMPAAHLRLNVTLLDSDTGRVIARVPIDETVPASENHTPAIIQAFDQAAANAVTKIAEAGTVRCGPQREKLD